MNLSLQEGERQRKSDNILKMAKGICAQNPSRVARRRVGFKS